MERNVINACSKLSLAADISDVYGIKEFAKLGVKLTPVVIVDGNLVVWGKVPTVNELKRIFSAIQVTAPQLVLRGHFMWPRLVLRRPISHPVPAFRSRMIRAAIFAPLPQTPGHPWGSCPPAARNAS